MLDPVATVDIHLAAVVYPGDPENDYPLRLCQAVEKAMLGILRVLR